MANEPKPISDPLKEMMARIDAKRSGGVVDEHTRKAVQAVAEEIAPEGKLPPQKQWLFFSPVPSDLCRVSPFFIMSKQELAKRPYIEDLVITNNNWGKITYTGGKLSVFDETVFLSIIALLDEPGAKEIVKVDGKYTTVWEGPVLKILELMGLKSDGKENYNRVRKSIKTMRATAFELILKSGNIHGCGLIDDYKIIEKSKHLRVVINPLFYELYAKGAVTRLDVIRRSKLPGSVPKCLYRFIMSHRDGTWKGHWKTLCGALNLDLKQEEKKVRHTLKCAINTLIKHEILNDRSSISGEVVTLHRVKRP